MNMEYEKKKAIETILDVQLPWSMQLKKFAHLTLGIYSVTHIY